MAAAFSLALSLAARHSSRSFFARALSLREFSTARRMRSGRVTRAVAAPWKSPRMAFQKEVFFLAAAA